MMAVKDIREFAAAEKTIVVRNIDRLSSRERDVASALWGFGGRRKTLSEVAFDYNVTVRRVRQVYRRAVRNLAHLMEADQRDSA